VLGPYEIKQLILEDLRATNKILKKRFGQK
jgi:hypothetical protein